MWQVGGRVLDQVTFKMMPPWRTELACSFIAFLTCMFPLLSASSLSFITFLEQEELSSGRVVVKAGAGFAGPFPGYTTYAPLLLIHLDLGGMKEVEGLEM